MKWYRKYLTVYNKPYGDVPPEIVREIREKIGRMKKNVPAPAASVVLIAHNEACRILACLWSLCDNICSFPVELIVVDNNSTDGTPALLDSLGVDWYEESRKGPGHARQCGLERARGKYYICIDSDSLYPPYYLETCIKTLMRPGVVACYGLWSFIPDREHSPRRLFWYERLRDMYLLLQHVKRPELGVRGMAFSFRTEEGKREGFNTRIIRGEDGYMAFRLKRYGKIKFLTGKRTRIMTDNSTMKADGSIWNSFIRRLKKGLKNFSGLFISKTEYKDRDSNLLK